MRPVYSVKDPAASVQYYYFLIPHSLFYLFCPKDFHNIPLPYSVLFVPSFSQVFFNISFIPF